MKKYKAESEHLRQTGGCINPDDPEQDADGTRLAFYVGGEGPTNETPPDAVNLWRESTQLLKTSA